MEAPYSSHIRREAGPLVVDAIHAATLDALLEAPGVPDHPQIFADLSLGAWRSHQVASEFSAQLGLAMPRYARRTAGDLADTNRVPSYADLIGAGIDAEAAGDRTVLTALDLATRIAGTVNAGRPYTFLVITPRYTIPWEEENALFVRFFVQGLRQSGSRLVLACADPDESVFPEDWRPNWLNEPETQPSAGPSGLLSLHPGVVEPGVGSTLAETGSVVRVFELPDGSMLVAPECRRRPTEVSRLQYDRLAVEVRPIRWLEAYAQFYGNNLYVDSTLLCAEAWQRFAEGADGIALRLMERAISGAGSPARQEVLRSQLQGMRIALRRFDAAAGAPDPSPAAPAALRGFLLQAKGWGLVMSNRPSPGETYLREARRALAQHARTREYLYLLNISALGRLRAGEPEKAMEMEKEIEAGLTDEVGDRRLEYINSINIARLERLRGDLDAAERYYERAFATTLGARSESDAVYKNVCLARLDAERGSNAGAFFGWLRAALHWASSSAPEALGTRVAAAIVRGGSFSVGNGPEKISAAFTSLLLDSASRLPSPGLVVGGVDLDAPAPPVFVRADQVPPGAIDRAVGADGWGVLGVPVPIVGARFVGPNDRRLRSLLYGLLKVTGPDEELSGLEAIAVDDRFGYELPGTACELLESCINLKIPRMTFGDRVILLDEGLREELEMALRVRLADAVAGVEFDARGARVTFKRYLDPKAVSAEEGLILASLDDEPALAELSARLRTSVPPDRLLESLRQLERLRIVHLSLLEEPSVLQRLVSGRL